MIDPTYTGPERRAPVHDAIRAAVRAHWPTP